jgi:lysophospholipase L1-like esterase
MTLLTSPVTTFLDTGAATNGYLVADLIASYFLLGGVAALHSRTQQGEWRKRFLLLTGTLFITIGALEVPSAIGILDYRSVFQVRSEYPWEEQGRIFDDELLWRSKPYYHQHIKYKKGNIGETLCLPPGPEREFDLQYDQNGFRNYKDFVAADIAIIGDSYVESPMMEDALIMSSVLAQLQKKSVVNLGMSGYGPQQEHIVMKRYVPQLHPKTVVWVFYGGNDLYDVTRYEGIKETAHNESGLSKLWKRSLTKNLLSVSSRVSRMCMANDYFAGNYVIIPNVEGGESRVYFLHGNPKYDSPQLKALDVVRATFAETYQLSRELGIQFVVVFAPAAFRVYYNLSTVIEVSEQVQSWEPNDLPQRLRAMFADISPDIGYLDLTPDLRSATEKGTRVFLKDDTHWTQEGNRIVAKAINDFLNSPFPQDPTPLMTHEVEGFLATGRLP